MSEKTGEQTVRKTFCVDCSDKNLMSLYQCWEEIQQNVVDDDVTIQSLEQVISDKPFIAKGHTAYKLDDLIDFEPQTNNYNSDEVNKLYEQDYSKDLYTIYERPQSNKPVCLFIIGAGASGKATIAEEISKRTGYINMHNHVFIEPVLALFDGEPDWGLIDILRDETLDHLYYAQQPLIQTSVCYFESKSFFHYLAKKQLDAINAGYDVYVIELECDIDKRRERNVSPHRLEMKPSKKDIEQSQKYFEEENEEHRMTAKPGELAYWTFGSDYLRIDTTDMTIGQVADVIVKNIENIKRDVTNYRYICHVLAKNHEGYSKLKAFQGNMTQHRHKIFLYNKLLRERSLEESAAQNKKDDATDNNDSSDNKKQ